MVAQLRFHMMKYADNKDYLPSWLVITKMVMASRQIDMLVIDPGCSCCKEKQVDIKNEDGTPFGFLQVAHIVSELCKAVDEAYESDEHQPGCPMEECS